MFVRGYKLIPIRWTEAFVSEDLVPGRERYRGDTQVMSTQSEQGDALSTEGVNAWLSSEALWPWPETPPWVSRWVLRLLKALPEAVGLRDRRGTFLTLSVSLLQCGTDCQPAEERHIETPTPHSIAPPGRQQETGPRTDHSILSQADSETPLEI